MFFYIQNRQVIPESAPDDVTPTAGLKSRQAVPVHVDRKLFDQVQIEILTWLIIRK